MTFRIVIATKQRLWPLQDALAAEGARVTWMEDVMKGLRAEQSPFDIAIIDGTTRSLSYDWSVKELKRRIPGVRIFTIGGEPRPDATHLKLDDDPDAFARQLYGREEEERAFEELGERVRWSPLFEVWARLDEQKVIVVGTEDNECFEQFESLAVLLASVPKTPLLPSLIKMGRDDDQTWAAFAPSPKGIDLHSLLRLLRHERKGLSPAALSWVGVNACSALELLHANGLRHGWVRCNAVHLSDDGAELSLQFPGIGALIEDRRMWNVKSSIGLAPRRDDIAPETYERESETNATDVFQLGHVLYEAATTHSAFSERPHDRAVRPPELPAAMSQLIVQMLEADPSRRPLLHHVSATLAKFSDEAGARRELTDARRRLRELLNV